MIVNNDQSKKFLSRSGSRIVWQDLPREHLVNETCNPENEALATFLIAAEGMLYLAQTSSAVSVLFSFSLYLISWMQRNSDLNLLLPSHTLLVEFSLLVTPPDRGANA